MAKEINPFIVTGKIEPAYFCDRVQESARLIKSLTNGNNMVIISPRRMGKTGLIQFCYEKPEIKKEYYTFFIDILHTSESREFTYLLGRRDLRNPPAPQPRRWQSYSFKRSNQSVGNSDLTRSPDCRHSTSSWETSTDRNILWKKFSSCWSLQINLASWPSMNFNR